MNLSVTQLILLLALLLAQSSRKQWESAQVFADDVFERLSTGSVHNAVSGNNNINRHGHGHDHGHHSNQSHHHTHNHNSMYYKLAMKRGVAGFIPKFCVHGAIIMSDRGIEAPVHNNSSNDTTNGNLSPDERKKLLLISARIRNVQRLESVLPFELTQWPAVFTHPCPIQPDNTHRSERGLSWAHYRIWKEFIHFDQGVLEQLAALNSATTASTSAPSTSSTTSEEAIISRDGVYVAFPNGTILKDGLQFRDRDILAIFEDDADSTIRRLNFTLQEEFSQMSSDLLYLGWCDGRLARPVPLCTHAYAVTRAGARKLVQYWEPCGKAIDEQFVLMAKNNLITWRKVAATSFRNTNKRYPVHGDKTFGIFHQNKWELGSFLNH